MADKEVRSRFTTLYIMPDVMKRINYYAQAADGEVSGLGVIKKDDKGRHVVEKVYLLEQESTAADTELSPAAISKLMTDMMKDDKDPGTLKFWWHSHAAMDVFWSGTDDTCAETLSKEFAFSLVVNKKGEKKCRLDLYAPFRITFDGVKVEEIIQDDVNLKAECEKEVKEKVKTPYEKYNNWHDTEYGYQGYHGRGFHGAQPHRCAAGSAESYTIADANRIALPEQTVTDIEDLISEATINSSEGGVLCQETWQNFIIKVLKDVIEKRYEKRSGCTQFATYNKEYTSCQDKHVCKSIKECAYWTKVLEECEADANKDFDVTESGEIVEKVDLKIL